MAELADASDLGSDIFDVGVQIPSSAPKTYMRKWLSGRALPCQGKCREFESRFPLHFFIMSFFIWRHSQVVRLGSAKPSSPVRIWLVPPFILKLIKSHQNVVNSTLPIVYSSSILELDLLAHNMPVWRNGRRTGLKILGP